MLERLKTLQTEAGGYSLHLRSLAGHPQVAPGSAYSTIAQESARLGQQIDLISAQYAQGPETWWWRMGYM